MNPGNQPSTPAIGLPPEQFAAAFPFHLAVDWNLRFLQAGATVRRLCPEIQPDASLAAVFRLIRPEGEITRSWILDNRQRFFLLEHRSTGLQLRGEFMHLPGTEILLFLGSPWFVDSAEIAARGLGFDDFAIHDPVVDMLQVFQASKIALADAKKLAGKLSSQRAELRVANERLSRQEAESRKLALIAARTDNAVVLTDAAGYVEWINEGFTRLTGYTLREVAGKKPGHVLQGPETDPASVQFIRQSLARGEGFTVELINYSKFGRKYWLSIEVQPIRDTQGRITHFMALERDVTERRRTADALRAAKEAAESANRAKSEFLAVMSHEIRTPLNAILGMTQLLRQSPLDPRQREFAETTARSGETLLRLINDILDFSKIESGEPLQLEQTDFSLRSLIAGVTRMLRPQAEGSELQLEAEVADEVPDRLRGDPGRVQQVVVNLLHNAIKFTERGGVTVTVRRVDSGSEAVRLRFEVRDSGIGISPQDLGRLFQPFTQADSGPSRRRGGTGLGLAISKRIVERMAGRIGVESEPGRGSLFWFECPFLPAAEPPTEAAVNAPAGIADRPSAGPDPALRILVADDHDANRRLVYYLLEGLGLRADFARNGREAIEAWERRGHDVILMDCQMPELDGLQATQEIRRRELVRGVATQRRVMIVALTANALKGDRERCLAAGMDDYLSKPFTVEELCTVLGRRSVPGHRMPAVQPGAGEGWNNDFDESRPAQLWEHLGSEGVRLVIDDFLRELPGTVARVHALSPVADGPEVSRQVHALRGIAASLGLEQLALQCQVIEDALDASEPARAAEGMALLPALAGSGETALLQWLAVKTAGSDRERP